MMLGLMVQTPLGLWDFLAAHAFSPSSPPPTSLPPIGTSRVVRRMRMMTVLNTHATSRDSSVAPLGLTSKGKRKRAPAGPPLPEEVVQDPGSADRAAGLLLSGEVAPELRLAGGPAGLPLTGEVAGQLALAGEPAGLPPTEEVVPRAGAGLLPTGGIAPQHVPQVQLPRRR